MILYTLHGNGYIDISALDSLKDVHVYVNLTNRCPCACTFCLRQTKEMLEGHSLWITLYTYRGARTPTSRIRLPDRRWRWLLPHRQYYRFQRLLQGQYKLPEME